MKTIKGVSPKRDPNSHKGENGRVLVVGGSIDYHGAPILAGMGALHGGADLVYLYVPECNFEVTRASSPNFIVRKYTGDFLNEKAVKEIIELGKQCDSIVIGPGLGEREETMKAVLEIVKNLHIPTVLDAAAMFALKKIGKFPLEQPIVITPHRGEFKEFVDRDVTVKEEDQKSLVILRSVAMDLQINILLKGRIDYVASEEGVVEKNLTGNAGMTVGGTGDVLAGLVGCFLAQGMEAFDAAKNAAFYNGKAGDILKKMKGERFTASEVAEALGAGMR